MEWRRVTEKGLLCTGSPLDLVTIMQVKEYRQDVNRSSFNSGLYHLILSKAESLNISLILQSVLLLKNKASWNCKENSENSSHEIFI